MNELDEMLDVLEDRIYVLVEIRDPYNNDKPIQISDRMSAENVKISWNMRPSDRLIYIADYRDIVNGFNGYDFPTHKIPQRVDAWKN